MMTGTEIVRFIARQVHGRRLRREDEIPSAEVAMDLAYAVLSGDVTALPVGRHSRKAIDRKDAAGISKSMVEARAAAGDVAWFAEQLRRFVEDGHRCAPSTRFQIPKPGKADKRDIDDPAELRRILSLNARLVIQPRAEEHLVYGQFGGREGLRLPRPCKRKGATTQDQLAWQMQQWIWEGRPVVVCIDLEKAFPKLVKESVTGQLRQLDMEEDAIEFAWSLVAINTRVPGSKEPITSPGVGVEQGNVLSGLFLDLTLAPILRAVEASGRVKTLAYLDDVYMLAPTMEEAEQAFRLFALKAKEAGFNNVRPLGVGEKASEIIETRIKPVTVLKTYLVGPDGIGLVEEKRAEALSKMIRDRISFNAFRKAAACQALSANKIEEYLADGSYGFDPVTYRVQRSGRSRR